MSADVIFDTFRCKLEDEVLVFINSGGKITRQHCPLSVLVGSPSPKPFVARQSREWTRRTPIGAITSFANGFSGDLFEVGKYYNLGVAYRKKFLWMPRNI